MASPAPEEDQEVKPQTGLTRSTMTAPPARVRQMAVAASAITIVVLASAAWWWGTPESIIGIPAGTALSDRLITIMPVAVASRLTIAGTVGAGKTVAVTAPFDGAVQDRRAQLGEHVAIGDVLVVMDTADVESRLREAQAALLKASIAVDVLNRWTSSPDVIRAKRTQEAAEATLAVLERQVAETKGLLNRGIVSRNEHDGLVQQRDGQRISVAGSRQDLQTTLDRGSADNRRLADLDFQNAKARLEDLQKQVEGGTVRAAAAGILTRPPVSAQTLQPPVAIEPGSRVTRGQPIFSIADTATLVIVGKIDEVDVNRIRVGQGVMIGSDAFPGEPIAGRVIGVSAEADGGPAGSRAPSFEVRAAFPGNANARGDQIRIGMSARMSIETRTNPQAIVVPVEAVRDAMTVPTVEVRNPRNGETRFRKVTLGATNENGIEILSGLDAGDVVLQPQ